jgi:hypothetical protein
MAPLDFVVVNLTVDELDESQILYVNGKLHSTESTFYPCDLAKIADGWAFTLRQVNVDDFRKKPPRLLKNFTEADTGDWIPSKL